MKVTLTFELPEEDEAFREHLDGWKAFSALREFDNWLRTQMKHGDKETVKLELARGILWDVLRENDIEL